MAASDIPFLGRRPTAKAEHDLPDKPKSRLEGESASETHPHRQMHINQSLPGRDLDTMTSASSVSRQKPEKSRPSLLHMPNAEGDILDSSAITNSRHDRNRERLKRQRVLEAKKSEYGQENAAELVQEPSAVYEDGGPRSPPAHVSSSLAEHRAVNATPPPVQDSSPNISASTSSRAKSALKRLKSPDTSHTPAIESTLNRDSGVANATGDDGDTAAAASRRAVFEAEAAGLPSHQSLVLSPAPLSISQSVGVARKANSAPTLASSSAADSPQDWSTTELSTQGPAPLDPSKYSGLRLALANGISPKRTERPHQPYFPPRCPWEVRLWEVQLRTETVISNAGQVLLKYGRGNVPSTPSRQLELPQTSFDRRLTPLTAVVPPRESTQRPRKVAPFAVPKQTQQTHNFTGSKSRVAAQHSRSGEQNDARIVRDQRIGQRRGDTNNPTNGEKRHAPPPENPFSRRRSQSQTPADSPVQAQATVHSEVSKKRKRQDEVTQEVDSTLYEPGFPPPGPEATSDESVTTARSAVVKKSRAISKASKTVAELTTLPSTSAPRSSLCIISELPAPPPASTGYDSASRVTHKVSPVLRKLRRQQMQRGGIGDAATYIKAELDAESAGRLQSGKGEVPTVDDSSAVVAIEEQEQGDQTKAAASPTVQLQAVDQPQSTEVGEQQDTTQTPTAGGTLDFEQFKKVLVSGIFREDELPAIYQMYLTRKLPFIESTEASIARAAQLVENARLKVHYPELHEVISSWYISVVRVESTQVTQPGEQSSQYSDWPAEDSIDTEMEDLSYSSPTVGDGDGLSQAQGNHQDGAEGMVWQATGSPSPSPSLGVFSSPAVSTQAAGPDSALPSQPVDAQQQASQVQSSDTTANMTSARYGELMGLEQQILSSNFGMSWPAHSRIAKRIMDIVGNHPTDGGVKLWLRSPDPLHNAGAQRRLWWQIRIMLRRNDRAQARQTMENDRDIYESEQKRRRRGTIRAPTTTRTAPSPPVSVARADPANPSQASASNARSQPTATSTAPLNRQQDGGRPVLDPPQTSVRPAVGRSVSNTLPTSQPFVPQSTSQQPSGSQSTAALGVPLVPWSCACRNNTTKEPSGSW